jgi:hypothetical protein
MGTVLDSPRGSAAATPAPTRDELRSLLDKVLSMVDADPEAGPTVAAGAAPVRFEFPDLDLAVDILRSTDADHSLEWDFLEHPTEKPTVVLAMDSEVANRYLQGKENVAIAIVRGRIKPACDARAAIRYFPSTKPVFERYRQVVEIDFPHLLVD